MPRDFNINISVGGGNRRGAFTGGNVYKTKSTLNSRNMTDNAEEGTNFNLSRVFTIGLAFNLAQKYNEAMGSYTENRIAQRKFDTALTFAKYGIGLAINPAVGLAYAVGDLGYRAIQYNISLDKKNKEARYFRELSGNNENSGTRYRGDYS